MNEVENLRNQITKLKEEIIFLKTQCNHNNAGVIAQIQTEILLLERDINRINNLNHYLSPDSDTW